MFKISMYCLVNVESKFIKSRFISPVIKSNPSHWAEIFASIFSNSSNQICVGRIFSERYVTPSKSLLFLFRPGDVHSSIGPTEMYIRHSNVHSSIGRTEMSVGHSNVHSSSGTNRNVQWTSKCPFVHLDEWTNGHCLMASTLVSNPHGVRLSQITSLQLPWHSKCYMSIGHK